MNAAVISRQSYTHAWRESLFLFLLDGEDLKTTSLTYGMQSPFRGLGDAVESDPNLKEVPK